MNPYSHLVLAARLEAQLNPEDPAEYYWGSVVPDVRYPAGMQRAKTHIPVEDILAFMAQYPQLKSFLQGYLVHCLADELILQEIFFRRFPFFLLQGFLHWRHLTVLLEMYHFEQARMDRQVSGTYNEVLRRLGVSKAVSNAFAQSINQYAATSSPQTRFADFFKMMGMGNDSRIQKYKASAQSFQNNRPLKSLLFYGIRSGRISEQIAETTLCLVREAQDVHSDG